MSTRITRSVTRRLEAAAAVSKKKAVQGTPQNLTAAGTSIVHTKDSVKVAKISDHKTSVTKNAPSKSAAVRSTSHAKRSVKGAKAPTDEARVSTKIPSKAAVAKPTVHAKKSVKDTKASSRKEPATKKAPSNSAAVKLILHVRESDKGTKTSSHEKPGAQKPLSESAAVKSAAYRKKSVKVTKPSSRKKRATKKALSKPAAVKSTVHARNSGHDAKASSHEEPIATSTPSESSSRGSSRKRSAPDQAAEEDAALSQTSGRANSPKRQRTNHEASAATKSPSESSSKGFFHTRSASDQRADDDAALSHNSGRANSPKKQRTLKRTIFWPEDALFQYPASILANSDLQPLFTDPRYFCDLPPERQQDLVKLLPKHVEVPQALDAEPTYGVSVLMHMADFRRALRYFQDNIRFGRYDEAWLRDAAEAIEERARGEFDEHEMQIFEDRWQYPLQREMFVQNHPEKSRGGGLGEHAGAGSESSIHIPSGDNWSSLRLGISDDDLTSLESGNSDDDNVEES